MPPLYWRLYGPKASVSLFNDHRAIRAGATGTVNATGAGYPRRMIICGRLMIIRRFLDHDCAVWARAAGPVDAIGAYGGCCGKGRQLQQAGGSEQTDGEKLHGGLFDLFGGQFLGVFSCRFVTATVALLPWRRHSGCGTRIAGAQLKNGV